MANKKRSGKNDESYHIYSVDGENFHKACKITDIPVEQGDELYVDVIPVELTDEFIEVLRRGVRVLYLRRMSVMAKKREQLGISKTARNDVRAMMQIEPRWFFEADENYLVIRRLAARFRSLQRTYLSYLNRAKALSDDDRRLFMEVVHAVEKSMMETASSIVSEAEKRYPCFNKVVEELGITGENHLLAREALAEILPYVQRTKSYGRLKAFFGLYKGKKGTVKIYSKTARHALVRLTTAILHNAYHKAKDEERILRRIWKTVKETRERLEAPA